MIAGILRIFYVLLPISLVFWAIADHAGFERALQYANSLQGRSGMLVINKEGKESRGTQLDKFLQKKIPTKDENWRNVYRNIGYQIDLSIRYIEAYWLWSSLALILLLGIFYLLARKNYK